MIKQIYHGIQKAVLRVWGNHNLRPGCRRLPARTFHTPVGTLRLVVRVCSPNDNQLPVIYVLVRHVTHTSSSDRRVQVML